MRAASAARRRGFTSARGQVMRGARVKPDNHRRISPASACAGIGSIRSTRAATGTSRPRSLIAFAPSVRRAAARRPLPGGLLKRMCSSDSAASRSEVPRTRPPVAIRSTRSRSKESGEATRSADCCGELTVARRVVAVPTRAADSGLDPGSRFAGGIRGAGVRPIWRRVPRDR